jgi:multidrug efflux pump subunit AcrA (membrane-fusion protein)
MYVMEGSELYTVTDLSSVWMSVFLDPEATTAVALGDAVDVIPQGASESIRGEVAFIYPTIDQATRTGRIRVDIPNPGGILRPGMYVNAVLDAGSGTRQDAAAAVPTREIYICPMHPEVTSEGPGTCPKCGMFLEKREVPSEAGADGSPAASSDAVAGITLYTCPMHPEVQSANPGDRCPKCGMFLEPMAVAPGGATLVVPESAVIATGTRQVVYLEREPGIFDAVEVTLGPASDGYYPVLRGLSPGARVVTQGAFLVDAEARLNPGAAGAYFGASGGPK